MTSSAAKPKFSVSRTSVNEGRATACDLPANPLIIVARIGVAMAARVPFISAIVPTYRNGTALARCVAALRAQDHPAPLREIIVVDNDAATPLAGLVASPELEGVRIIREAQIGSYAARNRGIAEAKGEILAFTDGDCVPDPAWLSEGVRALEETGALAVGGAVSVFPRDPARPNGIELFEMAFAFPQQRYVEKDGFAVTANLIARREAFERIGPFRADLRSGGDMEWGHRAAAAGTPIQYAPRALVRHEAHRTWREVYARALRGIGGERDRGIGPWRGIVSEFAPRDRLRTIRAASPQLGQPSQRARAYAAGIGVKGVRIAVRIRYALNKRPSAR